MKTLGLRHVALNVFDVKTCAEFYTEIFSMKIDWQPDDDNIYLTSGNDNLALHRVAKCERDRATQKLDHIGFFVATPGDVDEWFLFLKQKNIKIIAEPKTHRDNSRSLYCADPEGTTVQIIYINYK
ncbi:MAG TPA: VOC family protein [Coxiellaceae bacterium]|nr:MAG: glyoxalase [Gammaproteobacteria bacterium RIFCSPHIGHO2_12_FULL_36_30]HLB56028.1 VOC family protein [Coxiellaceae bacterium]